MPVHPLQRLLAGTQVSDVHIIRFHGELTFLDTTLTDNFCLVLVGNTSPAVFILYFVHVWVV